jgi:hypothetical protein
MKRRLPDLWHRYLARKVNRNRLFVPVSCVMVNAQSRSFESTPIYRVFHNVLRDFKHL